MVELNDSLPERLRQRAQAHGEGTAYLQKRHGVWQRWTWAQADAAVDAIAAGLQAGGLAPSAAVAIVSGARVEAVLAVLACQRAGLLPVLVNPAMPPGGLATQVEQSGAAAVLAEDQEQVDKVADVQSRLPQLQHLWVIDPKGTRAYRHVRAEPFQPLLAGSASPQPRARREAVGLFSAGVFQEPRLVVVSQATLLRQAGAAETLGLREGDRLASLFGLADPLGQFMAIVAPVLHGCVPCFGEDRLPAVGELRQCAPQVLAAPARLLERLRRETAARASRTGGLRGGLIRRWTQADRPGWWLRQLVGRPVALALGLGACRTVLTGYERLAPGSARFLARLGMDTRGLYSLAEAGGPVASFPQAQEPALCVLGGFRPHLLEERRLLIEVDGARVDTGDLVSLDGGVLHLIGRSADLLTLPDGSLLAPSVVEAELMAGACINQAVAVGGPAGGVTALVELDEVTLRDWARAHGLAFTTLRSFADSSEVRQLVEQAVAQANQRLPQAAQVRRAVLLPRSLEVANGELTPSLALRRAIVRNRYAHRLVG